jgi:hypothetical protein
MAGIIERIGSLAGTELAKAINLAHKTFQERMGVHNHTGRALVETVAEVCRNHPNLVGIGAGLLVEQLLVEEKRRHEAHVGTAAGAASSAPRAANGADGGEHSAFGGLHLQAANLRPPSLQPPSIKVHRIRPGRIAIEVFGALLLLKMGATGARLLRRKHHQADIWFAPAARVRLFSATIAAYNLASAIRSPKISATRNGAIAFFGTIAVKPLLKARPGSAAGALERAPPEATAVSPPSIEEPVYEPSPTAAALTAPA